MYGPMLATTVVRRLVFRLMSMVRERVSSFTVGDESRVSKAGLGIRLEPVRAFFTGYLGCSSSRQF